MFLHVSVCPQGGVPGQVPPAHPRDQVHGVSTWAGTPTPGTRYTPTPVPGTPPGTRYTPPGPGTPPWTRYTPWNQVHPPGPGTPPGTRYTPQAGTLPE